jgi:hypothetical protein
MRSLAIGGSRSRTSVGRLPVESSEAIIAQIFVGVLSVFND